MPLGGLGGFIIEKNQVPVAAIYLYVTNSSMGYFDFLISDPNYREKDRFEIIMELFQYCTKVAIGAGCECVFVTTAIPGVMEKMKELGVREELEYDDERRVIIYTYEKKNKVSGSHLGFLRKWQKPFFTAVCQHPDHLEG